ncbi:DNA-binding Lrp family transcriptional regulator [Trueperella bonasi]|uniref:DNA-binding Lrp family transcriptional regulator n=1 Tax=Trueperella bonasi TaxID=312286 RepID=A0ABT9NI80_9ACTO|nr:Lrp/AsnC ligand binding domain-containing protein [Trueperella bonasi]MDP9807107.1 DNA-binding Lrp family transcriptional regulator [Trueperella bonasi]
MITAIVMVDAEVDKIPEVADAIAGVKSVHRVYSVTGDVDLIAIVTVPEHEDLATVIPDHIAKVEGVKEIKTYLAFQEFSRADLEAAFDIGLD